MGLYTNFMGIYGVISGNCQGASPCIGRDFRSFFRFFWRFKSDVAGVYRCLNTVYLKIFDEDVDMMMSMQQYAYH